MTKVKNVIIINDFDYEQGGASKVAIDTANILSEQGFNVVFFSVVHSEKSTLDPLVKKVTLNGCEALKTKNKIKGIIKGLYNKECGKLLSFVLKDYSADDTIAHVHGWTKACSSAVFRVLRRNKIKTVVTLHDYFSVCPNGAFLNYKTNRCCNLKAGSINCLCCNCDSRNIFFKIYRFIRQKIYNKDIILSELGCIFVSDLQKRIIESQILIGEKKEVICSPVEELDKDFIPEKKFDFVYIGRDSREKGIDLFIQLAKKITNKSFLIVGDYKRNNIENLTVTGWVSEVEVEHYLKDSYCLIVPSLLPEPFGLVVVKAVAFGIKCLVSDNVGASDYIYRGTGFTFRQADEDDLYEKALIVLEEKSASGNINVLVSKEEYASRVTNFYERVLER